ncbi:MAG TPA: serine/threonine-protein kinase [Polyangiaceae bacterium]|jgi:serine/threonine-protein kinase
MLGERVAGKYELKRLLGSGSMGAVYEGVHIDLGKRLAIKLIHPEFGESPEVVARFRREARAASAVESDYIGQIFDFGRDEALGLYMVIEYLEGEDLEARLQRERWIGEQDSATIGLQVARGLAKAHAVGVIHRDLKPANIFLTKRDDGSCLAKILDFGISKFEPERGPLSIVEPTLTAHGTTLGTPQYMSPEQCEGKLALDVRTDVWSLCAVLYEMIAGEPAISDDGGHIATMQRIVRQDIAPLASRADWVPYKLAQVIDAGLTRDRNARIPNAMTLAAKLLEAFPDAGSRSSITAMVRKTDISELGPMSEAAPPTLSDPIVRAAAVVPVPVATAAPGVAPATLADTANPPTAKPPSSADPPSSNDDSVAIFARGEELPREILALREKTLKKKP